MMDYLEIFTDGLILTSLFWDCECEHAYVHPQSIEACPRCRAIRDEQPDSHANEVLSLCPELLTDEQRHVFIKALNERTQFKPSPYWNVF